MTPLHRLRARFVRRDTAPVPPSDTDIESASLRLILEHGSDVLMRLDSRWNRLFVSPSCKDVFGEDPIDVLITPALSLVHPDDRPSVRAILSGLSADGPPEHAMWRGLHRDGHVLWIEATYRRVVSDGGAVVIMRDITARKQAEDKLMEARARLEQMARIDPLTGLPNRDALTDAITTRIALGADVALFHIDLGRFRKINEIHGHLAGDGVLREVGALLAQEMTHEPMVARLRSDRFAALVHAPNGDTGLSASARDLIRGIPKPIRLNGPTVSIGASIGIAVAGRDGQTAEDLLRNAERAARDAKRSGGDTYRFYEPAMGEAEERAEQLKQALPKAIADREIQPWFQPVMRLDTLTPSGHEMLARWVHPVFGLLDPATFLPLAEDVGANQDLRASLLIQGCEAARSWPDHMVLSMNLSAADLSEDTLPATIADILERTGFDPMRLEVDVSERSVHQAPTLARANLRALQSLGVSLALDDFGSGLSSLRLLRDLPFDKVKIDRSLSRGLARNPDSDRFVAAVIGLGHALGLQVMAEGIETQAALDSLRLLGCTFGQGNLFQVPKPAVTMSESDWAGG
jgi:diguanylate cyclase (GGDEF)-like protein/PAS domain S-box-containing protein